jgi:glutamate decarboxylase
LIENGELDEKWLLKAAYLSDRIAAMGPFRLLSRGDQLPAFAFTTEGVTAFDVFDVSRRLRERGWLVPAYTFPANRTDLAVARIVVRNGFTHDLADLLLADLRRLHLWINPPQP